MRPGIELMREIAEAHFQRELARIQSILGEEARVREALVRLAAQKQSARDTFVQGHESQYLGADLMWEAWVLRAQKELNIELARVLARKSRHMDAVRRAFGRQVALDEISACNTAELTDRRSKAFLQTLLQSGITS